MRGEGEGGLNAGSHLDVGVLLLEVAADTRDRAAGANACNEDVHLQGRGRRGICVAMAWCGGVGGRQQPGQPPDERLGGAAPPSHCLTLPFVAFHTLQIK